MYEGAECSSLGHCRYHAIFPVAEMWPFFDFSKWRPSAILNFKKLEILTANLIRMPPGQYASASQIRADRSNRWGNMPVFHGGVRHLRFLKFENFLTAGRVWRANIH